MTSSVFFDPVGAEDERDAEEHYGAPLPPEDRIWRHPSEVGTLDLAAPTDMTPHRSWGMAAAGATAGALAVSLLWFTVGSTQDAPVVVRERVAVSPVVSTPPRLVDAEDWAAEVALASWAGVVRVDHSDDDGPELTGIVLRDDGVVVTSASALGEADQLTVRYSTGEHDDLALMAVDDVTDTAVLYSAEVDADPVVIASDPVDVGDEVAIVASLSDDAFVQRAEVTAVESTVTAEGDVLHDALAIDRTEIPPGAAVLDASGSVVGIITDHHDDNTTFATPIDIVRHSATELIDNGWVHHEPWFGIEVETVAPGFGRPGSARVVTVVDGSPADHVGLREGDLVTTVDGRSIETANLLRELLTRMEPGDWTTIVYYSDAVQHEARTQLGARPT